MLRAKLGIVAVVAAVLTPFTPSYAAGASTATGPEDVTVVAVIDSGFGLYHWDFTAGRTPQALSPDPTDDLPLDQAPDTWLEGFPDPTEFAQYSPLNLTLPGPGSPFDIPAYGADDEEWRGFGVSQSAGAAKYRWIPDSKVIGAVDFGGQFAGTPSSHGTGTSSVAAGNIHGACQECVLVLVGYSDLASWREAMKWVAAQQWIDVVSNSYGFSTAVRDNVLLTEDVNVIRDAVERGQSWVWSAGNGQLNDFTVPNHTLHSAMKGPDWVITVGAVSFNGESYTGSGKPADIAAPGTGYPSAYNAYNSGGTGFFNGTSNAAPVVAGTLARALATARGLQEGPSRAQYGGIVSHGTAECAECPIGDGILERHELVESLYAATLPAADRGYLSGFTYSNTAETRMASEGHGTWKVLGSLSRAEANAEFGRLADLIDGSGAAIERPEGEREWMTAVSFCRQRIWGRWSGGYWHSGDDLPSASADWPVRSALVAACPVHPAIR